MMSSGCEWLVEAFDCDPRSLTSLPSLDALFTTLIREMDLHPVSPPVWHQFPGPGGITGLTLLKESHLACHTFPEHGTLCLNVFCCRSRADWDFAGYLSREFGSLRVQVRRMERPLDGASATGTPR